MTRPLRPILAGLALAVLLAAGAARGQTTQQSGVWQQPIRLMPTWKARGVSTLMLFSAADGATPDTWCKAARDAGLTYILQADGTCDAHYADAACTGVMLYPDEPNSGSGNDPSYVSPGKMMDASLAVRKKTNKPLWLSLSGWNLQYQSDSEIAAFCATADVIVFDYYVINRGEGPLAIPKLGQNIDRLKRLAPGKQVFCAIETSDQKLPAANLPPHPDTLRGPTVNEFAAEIDESRRHGAGLMMFSHIAGPPWQGFDGTLPETSGAMTVLNRH